MKTFARRKIIFFLILTFFSASFLHAATYTWSTNETSGNWTDTSKWSSGFGPSTSYPQSSDTVTLRSNAEITLTSDTSISTLIAGNTSTTSITINLNNYTLTMSKLMYFETASKNTSITFKNGNVKLKALTSDLDSQKTYSINLVSASMTLEDAPVCSAYSDSITINGDSSSTLSMPLLWSVKSSTDFSDAKLISYSGDMNVNTSFLSGAVVSGTAGLGQTVSILFKSSVETDTLYYKADVKNSNLSRTEKYTLGSQEISLSVTSNTALTVTKSKSPSVEIIFPYAVDQNDGIKFSFYADKTSSEELQTLSYYQDSALSPEWSGTVSSDWSDEKNWKDYISPAAGEDINIPSSAVNFPLLDDETTPVYLSVSIEDGAKLTVDGASFTCKNCTNSGTLTLTSGTFTVVDAIRNENILNFNGADIQSVPSSGCTNGDSSVINYNADYSSSTMPWNNTFNEVNFNSAKGQFTSAVNAKKITLKDSDITFDAELNETGGSLSVSNSTLNVKGKLNISKGVVNIDSSSTCLFEGNIEQTSSNDENIFDGDITFTSSVLKFEGPLTFGKSSAGNVKLNSSSKITITSNNNKIVFNSAVSGNTKDFYLDAGSAAIEIKGNFGSEDDDKKIGYFDITSDGLLIESSIYCTTFIHNCKNKDSSYAMLSGLVNAQYNVTFSSDLYIYGSSKISSGSGFSIEGDLHECDSLSVNSWCTIKGSFVFYAGQFSFVNELEVKKDLVLLGSAYKEKDDVSGVDNLFSYGANTHTLNTQVKTAYPNSQSTFPLSYSATFSDLGGKQISVGENFYDNGMDLISASQWNLKLGGSYPEENFAEVYNCTVKNCTASACVAAAEASDGTLNTNFYFTTPQIIKVQSLSDSIVCMEFDTALLGKDLKNKFNLTAFNSVSPKYFAKIGSGSNEKNELTGTISEDRSYTKIYLKTDETLGDRWNSDATGTSCGSDESTDWGRADVAPKHQTNVLDIVIAKADTDNFYTLRDIYGNRIKHYVTSPCTLAEDKCAPVLCAVYTGQELHTQYSATEGVSSQPYYDAHNFIEFRYSEPVTIGSTSLSDFNNIQASTYKKTYLVEQVGGEIINNSSGINISGFGSTQNGHLEAMEKIESQGEYSLVSSTTIHSLYRNFTTSASSLESEQPCRIRIGIASYVKEDIDVNSSSYHNWTGVIKSALTPSGTFIREKNLLIQDLNLNDYKYENLSCTIKINEGCQDEPSLTESLYGDWDTSSPVFALFIKKTSSVESDQVWEKGNDLYKNSDGQSLFEVIGSTASSSSSYLDRLEFHVFDNKPSYSSSDTYKWISKYGWAEGESIKEYAADISGGSRSTAFKGSANRTLGGVRFSSFLGSVNSFSYKASDSTTEKYFSSSKGWAQEGKSPFFIYTEDSSLANKISGTDSLYFDLFLDEADTNISLTEIFDINIDSSKCFITDLAGNLIEVPASGKLKSLDRVSPAMSLSLAAVGKNELYMLFSKKLSAKTNADFMQIADELEFIINTSDPTSDSAVRDSTLSIAGVKKILYENTDVSGVIFTLNRNITLSDIKGLWIRVKKPQEKSLDPITGVDSFVTKIQDVYGNYSAYYSCHTLSDLAINAVLPLNAYTQEEDGELSDPTLAFNYLTDFSSSSANNARVFMNRDIYMQLRVNEEISSDKTYTDALDTNALLYFDSTPDQKVISDNFNKLLGENLKLWFPTQMLSFSSGVNVPQNPQGLSQNELLAGDSSIRKYTILDKSDADDSFKWTAGSDAQFIAALTDTDGNIITVDTDASGSLSPLYAVRLTNPDDITSLDLWHIGIAGIKKQRGGVTVMSNVVNPNKGDQCTIQVEANEGKLLVSIMTLDGNIVKTLENSNVKGGTILYHWDGKNKKGRAVARGIYFVRVVGEEIDETRKVLVVK